MDQAIFKQIDVIKCQQKLLIYLINKAKQKADDPEHLNEPFSYKKNFDEKKKM